MIGSFERLKLNAVNQYSKVGALGMQHTSGENGITVWGENLYPHLGVDCPLENHTFREFVFMIVLIFDLSCFVHFRTYRFFYSTELVYSLFLLFISCVLA